MSHQSDIQVLLAFLDKWMTDMARLFQETVSLAERCRTAQKIMRAGDIPPVLQEIVAAQYDTLRQQRGQELSIDITAGAWMDWEDRADEIVELGVDRQAAIANLQRELNKSSCSARERLAGGRCLFLLARGEYNASQLRTQAAAYLMAAVQSGNLDEGGLRQAAETLEKEGFWPESGKAWWHLAREPHAHPLIANLAIYKARKYGLDRERVSKQGSAIEYERLHWQITERVAALSTDDILEYLQDWGELDDAGGIAIFV